MSKKTLKDFCESIWSKPEYRSALEVLYANRPNRLPDVMEVLENCDIVKEEHNSGVYNFFLRFNENSPLRYRLLYDTKGKGLKFVIVTKEDRELMIETKNFLFKYDSPTIIIEKKVKIEKPTQKQYGYYRVSQFTGYFLSDDEMDNDEIEITDVVVSLLKQFKLFDDTFVKINEEQQ